MISGDIRNLICEYLELTHVYQGLAPQSLARDCDRITYTWSETKVMHFAGAASLKAATFTFNCWSISYDSALQTREDLFDLLIDHNGETGGSFIEAIEPLEPAYLEKWEQTPGQSTCLHDAMLFMTVWYSTIPQED